MCELLKPDATPYAVVADALTGLTLSSYSGLEPLRVIVGSDAGGIAAVAMVSPTITMPWIIDRRDLAGEPVFQVKATGFVRPTSISFQALVIPPHPGLAPPPPIHAHGSLTITLTGGRWPGTEVSADLSLELVRTITTDDTSDSLTISLTFGGFQYGDDFTFNGEATSAVTLAGAVCGLGPSGAITFSSGSANASFIPGQLKISASGVAQVTGFGDPLACQLLEFNLLGPNDPRFFPATAAPLGTRLLMNATTPWTIPPVISQTPIGTVTPNADLYDTLRVEAGEGGQTPRQQAAAFSATAGASQPQMSLQLGSGVVDPAGNPVVLPLFNCSQWYDFVAPLHVELHGDCEPGARWIKVAGVGLRLSENIERFDNVRFIADGPTVTVGQCDIPFGAVSVPMGDAIVEPVQRPAFVSLMATGMAADPQNNPNWLIIGLLQNQDVRLFLRDFALRVVRPMDLLALQFDFQDMALEAGDGIPLAITRTIAGQAGAIAVTFPPQHMAEEAYDWLGPGSGPPPGASPPIATRLAGETCLSFIVPGDSNPLALTLDNLLDWAAYPLRLQAPTDTPIPPAPFETSIELPWRLMLSPDAGAGFSHAYRPATQGKWTELWHTRLGVRKPLADGAGFYVDERVAGNVAERTGRAVWSPDYFPAPPRPQPGPVGGPPPAGDDAPFAARASLTRLDRHDIVDHFSNDPASRLSLGRLMLSTQGGSLDSRVAWDANIANSLTEWRHTASYGRDQYVRVVRNGRLCPFGHRSSVVEVSERKFSGEPGNSAYLRKQQYLVVTQPVLTYADTGRPRELPFTEIEIITLVTPPIDPPSPSQMIMIGGNTPFQFNMRATDLEGQRVDFDSPAVWIDESDPSVIPTAINAFNAVGVTTPVNGQKVAFAPASKPGAGDTTFAAESLQLDARGLDATAAPNSQPFLPVIAGAKVHLPTVRQLAAGADAPVDIQYFQTYLDHGLDDAQHNGGQVFANLVTPISIAFGGDKANGVAAPEMNIVGLSRSLGAVGGVFDPSDTRDVMTQKLKQSLDKVSRGQFDPRDFLQQQLPSGREAAQLLGGITLDTVVDAVSGVDLDGDAVPKFKVDTSDPTRTVTQLSWTPNIKPEITPTPGSLLTLAFRPSDGPPLSILSQVTTVNPTAGTTVTPTSSVTGTLRSFDLAFAGFVTVSFDELRFHAESGKKREVVLTLASSDALKLGGQLDFLQVLMEPLKGLLGSGPSLDIEGDTIEAGYAIALPAIGIGVFDLENIQVGVGLSIPLSNNPVGFRFNFAEKDQPFTLTISLLGGGGFFAIEADSKVGLKAIELAVEAGAAVSIDLGVASGSAHVMIGVYFRYESSGTNMISGFVRAGGELTVLQLISLHVEFYLGLTYVSSPGRQVIWGEASLMVDVAVGFLHQSVTLQMRREFEVSGSTSAAAAVQRAVLPLSDRATSIAQTISREQWNSYAAAFA